MRGQPTETLPAAGPGPDPAGIEPDPAPTGRGPAGTRSDPTGDEPDLTHHGDAEVGEGLVDLAVNVRRDAMLKPCSPPGRPQPR